MHRSKKAVVGLCLLRFCPHESAALQTLGGPDCVKIVEFRNRLTARWQRHPRLFGGCVNVDVWRTEIRVVHGTDADEPNDRTGLRVVAPNRDPAGWAAGDLLALAARRGCHDDFGVPPSLSFVSIMNCRQRCCSIGTTDASSTTCMAVSEGSPPASLPTPPGARALSCRGSSRYSPSPHRRSY